MTSFSIEYGSLPWQDASNRWRKRGWSNQK